MTKANAPLALIVLLTAIFANGQSVPAQENGFTFPNDASGKALAERLPPKVERPIPDLGADGPVPRLVPRAVQQPAPPLPAVSKDIPKLPPIALDAPLPGAVPELPPLSQHLDTPPVPERPQFAVGPLRRVPSVDVNVPPTVIKVTQPAGHRAALGTPTQDASKQAALAATPPPRSGPTPFLRLKLPAPFEHRKAAPLPYLPESSMPMTARPQVPE